MTKEYETIYTGTVSDILKKMSENKIKGEFCFVISFKKNTNDEINQIKELKNKGFNYNQALYIGTKLLEIPRNLVYKLYHES